MKYLLLLLLMLCAAPVAAQSNALIIDGNRYIVNTSRNGTVTVESWPMPPMQQRNYNHARKYGTYVPQAVRRAQRQAPAPARTQQARTFMPTVRRVIGGCVLVRGHYVCT